MLAEAKLSFTLAGMSETDASTLGVDAGERNQFVRFDFAKSNVSKPTDAVWFQRDEIRLPHDAVGILRSHRFAGIWEKITTRHVLSLQSKIRQGAASDEPSDWVQSGQNRATFVSFVVDFMDEAHDVKLSDAEGKVAVNAWMKAEYFMTENRYIKSEKKRAVVVAGAAKPGPQSDD